MTEQERKDVGDCLPCGFSLELEDDGFYHIYNCQEGRYYDWLGKSRKPKQVLKKISKHIKEKRTELDESEQRISEYCLAN